MSGELVRAGDINYRVPVVRLLEGARRQQKNINALLADAGVDLEQLTQKNYYLDSQQFVQLLQGVTYSLGDEFFGLSERRAKLGTLSMMADIALSAKNLQGALLKLARLIELMCDDIELQLHQKGELVHLEVVHTRGVNDPQQFLADYLLFFLHRMSSWLIAYLIPVSAVHFTGSKEVNAHRFIDLLMPDWQANASSNAIYFHVKYLTMPVVRDSLEWLEHVDNLRGGVFSWPSREGGMAQRVRRVLSAQLRATHELLSLQQVADEIAMSPQTLRRRLHEEGESFQGLMDSLRRSLAIEALSLHKQSVEQVSEQLGFTEPRSFSRAFKKWTGMPPSEYIKRAT